MENLSLYAAAAAMIAIKKQRRVRDECQGKFWFCQRLAAGSSEQGMQHLAINYTYGFHSFLHSARDTRNLRQVAAIN